MRERVKVQRAKRGEKDDGKNQWKVNLERGGEAGVAAGGGEMRKEGQKENKSRLNTSSKSLE